MNRCLPDKLLALVFQLACILSTILVRMIDCGTVNEASPLELDL